MSRLNYRKYIHYVSSCLLPSSAVWYHSHMGKYKGFTLARQKANDKYMSEIHIVRTTMKFDLAQKCNCFSMQDCIDGCIALAWENIDDYEEYPENGRLVFNFGEAFEDVERKFALRGVLLN